MAPGPTTLLPVLGAEMTQGAADLTQEALGAGAADEVLGQTGPRVTGPHVDEPRARRLAGSTTHSRTVVQHDVARFAGSPDLSHSGRARLTDEASPAAQTSARVDRPRADHSWPFAFVAGIEPAATLLMQPFASLSALSPAGVPTGTPERFLARPPVSQARAPSSSDLIGEIFGGGPSASLRTPIPAPRVARTAPSDVAKGPDIFRNRVTPLEGDSPKGVPPKPPRPVSRVLDPLGTGEFIMNPLVELMAVAVDPALEVVMAEDIAKITLRLTGLSAEIYQSIDAAFAELGGLPEGEPSLLPLTREARGVFDGARAGLKLTYDAALTRVSHIFTQARHDGSVVLEIQDVEALVKLAGVGYGVGHRIGVMALTRLIRDEILGPRGTQRRTDNVSQVVRLARLNAPSFADTNPHHGTTLLDARSSRPEERRDEEPGDATDAPLVMGTTASAGADANAEDQGEQRNHSNQ